MTERVPVMTAPLGISPGINLMGASVMIVAHLPIIRTGNCLKVVPRVIQTMWTTCLNGHGVY